jgi:hypothetical protein
MEEYRIINQFEKYSVSNLGNVKKNENNQQIQPFLGKNLYLYVALESDNYVMNRTIHRLVAIAFHENPEEKKVVDHINRIRTDNNSHNLRWCTHAENLWNQTKRRSKSGYSGIYHMKYTNKWKAQLMANGKIYKKIFDSIEDAIGYRVELEKTHFGIYAPQILINKISIHLDDTTNIEELERELDDLLNY